MTLDLSPAVLDLVVETGDDRNIEISFLEEDAVTPVDLTGLTPAVDGPVWIQSAIQSPPAEGKIVLIMTPNVVTPQCEWRLRVNGSVNRVMAAGKVQAT